MPPRSERREPFVDPFMEELWRKLNGGENCRLLMALVAGASARERQMVRMLIRELDQFDIDQGK